MRLIEGLYISFYRFSSYFKENISGSIFYNQRFDSIAILTALTMINISGIWKLINIEPLFTTRKLDLVLGVIVIGGIFTLIFERKAKYKELLVKYKNESFILLGWTYAIISLSMVIFLSI